MTDPRNVRRWLATLANAYPSLLVSGVARNALAEIERRGRDLAIEKNLNDARQMLTAKLEAKLAIAVEALDLLKAKSGYWMEGANEPEFTRFGLVEVISDNALAKIKETE